MQVVVEMHPMGRIIALSTYLIVSIDGNNIGEKGVKYLTKVTNVQSINSLFFGNRDNILDRNDVGNRGCKHLSKDTIPISEGLYLCK